MRIMNIKQLLLLLNVLEAQRIEEQFRKKFELAFYALSSVLEVDDTDTFRVSVIASLSTR